MGDVILSERDITHTHIQCAHTGTHCTPHIFVLIIIYSSLSEIHSACDGFMVIYWPRKEATHSHTHTHNDGQSQTRAAISTVNVNATNSIIKTDDIISFVDVIFCSLFLAGSNFNDIQMHFHGISQLKTHISIWTCENENKRKMHFYEETNFSV